MRETSSSFTYCAWQAKYRLYQIELFFSRWRAFLLSPSYPTPPQNRPVQVPHNCKLCPLIFSPYIYLFFLPLHYCNGLEPDPVLILLLFKAFSLLSWAIFYYPWPSIIDSINTIWLFFFPVDSEKWGKRKLFSIILPIQWFSWFSSGCTRSEIAFCTNSKSFHLIMHTNRCPHNSNQGLHAKLLMWTLTQCFISVYTRVYSMMAAICLFFCHFIPFIE